MALAVHAKTLPTLNLRRFDAGGAEGPRFLVPRHSDLDRLNSGSK